MTEADSEHHALLAQHLHLQPKGHKHSPPAQNVQVRGQSHKQSMLVFLHTWLHAMYMCQGHLRQQARSYVTVYIMNIP
jgi:hypothetical protein